MMLVWLSDLNWWGAFGMLCGIGVVSMVMRYAMTKTADKPGSRPAK